MRRFIVLSLFCCCITMSVARDAFAQMGQVPGEPVIVAANSPPRSITIDGVEYVPKEKVQNKRNDRQLSVATQEDPPEQPEKSSESSPLAGLFSRPNGNLENFEMKGKIGVGVEVSLVNIGIGPTVEYWFTNNIDLLAHYSGLGDFRTIGARAEYLLDKPFKIYHYFNTKPYLGIGYSSVKWTGDNMGTDLSASGSGVDFHAGILTSAQYLLKNLMMRLEVGYSTVDLKFKSPSTGIETSVPGWGGFGVAYGAYYYF